MLKFDAETTRLLEIAYQGAEITRRRQASFDALRPEPGETILDIGCGNGLLTAELARAVGPDGKVIGIDPSDEMRKPAVSRCKAFDWVEISQGTAHELPIGTEIADKAVSTQVFEYLDDIPGAVQEVFRTLKAGARFVIGDIHFDSFLWFSDHPDRMRRMMRSWDHHLTERCIPAILPPILRSSGFAVDEIRPLTLCDHLLKSDGLASVMMQLMKRYALVHGHVSEEEATAWFDEQTALAAEGRFFFSITHFVICARKT